MPHSGTEAVVFLERRRPFNEPDKNEIKNVGEEMK